MGPLKGIRVIEVAGLGPGPFCAMMLADMGAEVIRVERLSAGGSEYRSNVLNRGRRSLALDLKVPQAVEAVLKLVESADVLIEGFRPGVMERLGLGPEVCLERNPRLVFGRMTGWGQSGPLAGAAGHDINYIALGGALGAMGYADRPPTPPLNLVGDFGGGGMYLLAGVLAALVERQQSGQGQVIDAAMTDGVASLLAPIYGLMAAGRWNGGRSRNLLDGGAHFYGCYECGDGRYVAIGSLEPQFYALLLEKCGISDPEFGEQHDQTRWPQLREKLAALFKTRTRDEWCELLEGSDVCFAPVLDLAEVPEHPHNRARKTFVEVDNILQPAPAPRFSRTPGQIQSGAAMPGEHSEQVLRDWGITEDEIAELKQSGATG
ncbi:MAG: CaiB/BaiF CoA transferase family protein [Pseudohongiellaceae bacterium]